MNKKETTKASKRLELWQKRLADNKAKYEEKLAHMDSNEEVYNGTNKIDDAPDSRRALNVYNVAFELIEGQVDSTIPLPRVRTCNSDAADMASQAEEMLRAKTEELPFEELNDVDERNTYVQGADFMLIEWDSMKNTHKTQGDLSLSIIHPKLLIPQDGVIEINEMDYLFVISKVTKVFIKKRYGKDVQQAGKNHEFMFKNKENEEEVVVLNTAYFKNENAGIGRFVWASDTVLEDLQDYQARILQRCKRCNEVCETQNLQDEAVCETCGGKTFYESKEEFEEIKAPIIKNDGTVILPQQPVLDEDGKVTQQVILNENGEPRLDEFGVPITQPIMNKTKIPYYKPNEYPIIMRRNVSKSGSFLGTSDIDVLKPQQEAIKKLTTNVMEKLLKGGSYVTLPSGVKVETTDKQLKILRVDSPAQKSLIDVINLQPNISFDMMALNDQYEKAKSVLGITDSFQGKKDTSAISGVAKQFAAAQTAGRLESKRRMKQAFYEKIYKMMFKFMLAYADEPVNFLSHDEKGNEVFSRFNRYDFLKVDEAGEYYWDDEFLFSVDVTGGLAQNREAMWKEAENQYRSGALGDPKETSTRLIYWNLLEQLQFPMAKSVKQSLIEEKEKQEMQLTQEVLQAQGLQNGGLENDMNESEGWE